MHKILVWFRQDLRLHDHEPLFNAFQKTKTILPLYVFPDWEEKTEWGFPRIGTHRKKFWIESVEALRWELKRIGADLVVREGKARDRIAELVLNYEIQEVYFYRYPGTEEEYEEKEVISLLDKIGVTHQTAWGKTLQHIEDLPFPLAKLPEIFTPFKNRIESLPIRKPLPKVRPLAHLPSNLDMGSIPILPSTEPEFDPRSAHPFRGGESEGIQRLTEFLWVENRIQTYKETRNGLLGSKYSSKLSAYLAVGALSPRFVFQQYQQFIQEKGSTENTYWFFYELLWRDYFQWILCKHQSKVFRSTGILGKAGTGEQNEELFALWTQGKTESSWVNAFMKELLATGYMSNRGRQNVASYFVHSLKLDWRMGAAWFESQLVDYDVASNWGNWAYFAGVGNDPRARLMNMNSQAQSYDPEGQFQSVWNTP